MRASELFDWPESLPFADRFDLEAPPWTWVEVIAEALRHVSFGQSPALEIPPGLAVEGPVHIDASVKLPPYGVIEGPAFIGPDCVLRPGVYVRGNVICGRGCMLGNSCEFKNCLLLDDVQVPHFNYVGDSVLGNHAHLGAGAICSNLRLDQQPVRVRLSSGKHETGLRKLGAMLGDGAEVGCNATLQPGTILGRKAAVGPNLAFGGTLEPERLALGTREFRVLPR